MAILYVNDDYIASDYYQTALFVHWPSKVIFGPKFESVLIQSVPMEVRQLDINIFRLALKDIEDDEGMSFKDTHRHNTTVSVGGAVLARVVEIINGYTVTFEDGEYAINLVGANSNIGDVVNVNRVSVRSANSAGLQDLNSLQAASFAGGVAIDTSSAFVGTAFPVGTRSQPVNNLVDAISIAATRGLKNIFVANSLTISGINLSDKYLFIGDSIHTAVTIDASADVTQCEFRNMTVSGTLVGQALLRDCAVTSISMTDGNLFSCAVIGSISISGATQCTVLDCYSAVPDVATAVAFDFLNATPGHVLIVRGWKGDLRLINCSSTVYADIGMIAGHVSVESSVSAGIFGFYNGAIVESSAVGTTVINDHSMYTHLPASTWGAQVSTANASGSIGEKIRKNLLR